jgi:hypothetical protein
MMLDRLAAYLQRRGSASLTDIALHLDADESAVRPMLDLLMRKGKVIAIDPSRGCGSGCGQCASAEKASYAWRSSLVSMPQIMTKD